MKFLLFAIAALAGFTTCAQSVRYPVAVPYTGLSAYSSQQNDVFSFTGNQAALSKNTAPAVGVYAERRFLLAAVNAFALATVIPTNKGNFGVQLNYAGFKNFNENKLGLAYARNLGSKAALGVQFNYYSYRVPAYGSATAVYAEAGAIFNVTRQLTAGVHIYNPMNAKLGKTADEKLAAAYKFGLGYDAAENFFISGEILKEEDKPVNVQAGMQYQFARQFFARVGFLSESSIIYAGAGVNFGNIRVDVAGSYHPLLGLSPAVVFIANFAKKSE